MRLQSKYLALFLVLASLACGGGEKAPQPSTPLETLNAYGNAFKKKDLTTMKMLLSEDSIRMHEQEAKAQNVTVDDIVARDTLFSQNQTTAQFRNQKIEENKASLEMVDSTGIWNTIHFVREEGVWKIDRSGFAKQIEQEVQQSERKADEIFNQGRKP